MKIFILAIITLIFSRNSYSQSERPIESSERKLNATSEDLNQSGNNEIKLNLATAIAGLPELTYERIFYDNMGAGISLAISLEKVENMMERYQALAFYRLYFGKKKANGFFIEGNMAVIGQEENYDVYDYNYSPSKYIETLNKSTSNFGFGGAIGMKLLTRNGFSGELYAGGGRLFGIEDPTSAYDPEFNQGFARVGITIGKRF